MSGRQRLDFALSGRLASLWGKARAVSHRRLFSFAVRVSQSERGVWCVHGGTVHAERRSGAALSGFGMAWHGSRCGPVFWGCLYGLHHPTQTQAGVATFGC